MSAGAQKYVFGLSKQFLNLYKKLKPLQEKMLIFKADSEDDAAMRNPIFEVEVIPLEYTGAQTTDQFDLRVVNVSQKPVGDIARPF